MSEKAYAHNHRSGRRKFHRICIIYYAQIKSA